MTQGVKVNRHSVQNVLIHGVRQSCLRVRPILAGSAVSSGDLLWLSSDTSSLCLRVRRVVCRVIRLHRWFRIVWNRLSTGVPRSPESCR